MALTYDAPSTTAKIYIDGQQTCINAATPTNPSNIAVARDFFIGRSFHNNPTLSGEINCFRIYSRALRSVVCVIIVVLIYKGLFQSPLRMTIQSSRRCD